MFWWPSLLNLLGAKQHREGGASLLLGIPSGDRLACSL